MKMSVTTDFMWIANLKISLTNSVCPDPGKKYVDRNKSASISKRKDRQNFDMNNLYI